MGKEQLLNREFIFQMQRAFECGYRKCAESLGLLKPYMSLNEAYRIYGRAVVDRWIKDGVVTPIKGVGKNRIRRDQIEMVASMSERSYWWNDIPRDLTCD